ncbi:MAG TPA: FAD-dependent oxidoreductase, partial [Kribbella sp.]|nr:FAD-dependent oxidoreductase [Kribbella sp.]
MTFAISGDCCSDASCVAVCPMNSIHPSPGEPGFGTGASLFIDPRTCIDCGACADICPVDAAKPADSSAAEDVRRNAEYFAERDPLQAMDLDSWEPPAYQVWGGGPRRVLVVGAGPAGMYATRELLLRTTAEVTVVDRSRHLGGLVRFGVAPDHPQTKQIIENFERQVRHRRVHWRPGTDAATLPSGPNGLPEGYDAVVHAVGARQSRRLGITGEDAACSAEDFVAWYNGRPGAALPVELVGPQAVVIGNGNVALDLARILLTLTSPPQHPLTSEDPRAPGHRSSDAVGERGMEVSPAVRRTLAASGIKKVVLLGRRGPDEAAYTESALQELLAVAGDRVELRFHARPTAWTAGGLNLGTGETIAAGNLFTAIGFEGRPIAGLPFDAEHGIVPNDRG